MGKRSVCSVLTLILFQDHRVRLLTLWDSINNPLKGKDLSDQQSESHTTVLLQSNMTARLNKDTEEAPNNNAGATP